jgi:hypothetical protein
MRTLAAIKPLNGYKLECVFEDGTIKIADLSSYLNAPAFTQLLHKNEFYNVSNEKYFVEWKEYEVDLSSDTLWHIGKTKQ